MTFDDYAEAARLTYKGPPGHEHMLLNAALGIAGEAGEVADSLKKSRYPSKPGDGISSYSALVEELGDVLWYVSLACDGLGVSLGEVAERNLAKLSRRHAAGGNAASHDATAPQSHAKRN